MESETEFCRHFGSCGGCSYQSMPYEKQLELKASMVRELLGENCPDEVFEGIKGSPRQYGYRNKMEYSFGDLVKDGPLELGLHKRGSFHDIITVDDCRIADEDFRAILGETTPVLPENASYRVSAPSAGKKGMEDRRDPGGTGDKRTDGGMFL